MIRQISFIWVDKVEPNLNYFLMMMLEHGWKSEKNKSNELDTHTVLKTDFEMIIVHLFFRENTFKTVKELHRQFVYMRHIMRKLDICLSENKGADQLHDKRGADQCR